MDFVQNLDPSKLVLVEAGLSFLISPFTAPTYNLPIFLFGLYAQENAEAAQSLRVFVGLVGASALFDVVYMFRHPQNVLVKLVLLFILVLKFPTFLSFGTALRSRNGSFGGGLMGGGETVWSMPGGFTSVGGQGRDGYQPVEERAPAAAPPPPAAPTGASVPPNSQGNSGAYQSV